MAQYELIIKVRRSFGPELTRLINDRRNNGKTLDKIVKQASPERGKLAKIPRVQFSQRRHVAPNSGSRTNADTANMFDYLRYVFGLRILYICMYNI